WSHRSEMGTCSRRWRRRMATFSWAVSRLRVFLAMGEPPLGIVAYPSGPFFPFRLKQDNRGVPRRSAEANPRSLLGGRARRDLPEDARRIARTAYPVTQPEAVGRGRINAASCAVRPVSVCRASSAARRLSDCVQGQIDSTIDYSSAGRLNRWSSLIRISWCGGRQVDVRGLSSLRHLRVYWVRYN